MQTTQPPHPVRSGVPKTSSSWRRSALNWSVTVVSIMLVLYWVPVMEAWQSLTKADPSLLLLAALMTFFNIALRGLRWVAFIGLSRIRRGDIFISTQLCAIALGFNAILPAKAGEIARIGLARRHLRLSMGHATQAALVEKFFDMIVLLGMVAIMLQFISLDRETDYLAKAFQHIFTIALLMAMLLIILAIPRFNHVGRRILYTVLHYLRAGHHGRRVLRFLRDFGNGVRRMTSVEMALVSVITPTIWLILGVGGYFLALAMPDVSLSLPAAIAFVAATVLVTALPSAPGGWGIFEAAGLAFILILADSVQIGAAASFVLSAHLIQYIPVVLSGAAAWHWLASPQKR